LILNGNDMERRYGKALLRGADGRTMMMVYAAGFASIFLVFLLLHVHAYRRRRDLQLNALEQHDTVTSMMESASMTLVGVTSGILAAALPPNLQAIPGFWFLTIPVFMTIIGTVRGKSRKKYLTEAVEPVHAG
jgi:hypothetical protein